MKFASYLQCLIEDNKIDVGIGKMLFRKHPGKVMEKYGAIEIKFSFGILSKQTNNWRKNRFTFFFGVLLPFFQLYIFFTSSKSIWNYQFSCLFSLALKRVRQIETINFPVHMQENRFSNFTLYLVACRFGREQALHKNRIFSASYK